VGFGLVALLIAGALSYLADPDPDGLDAVTRQGCTATVDGHLEGDCMARHARQHPLVGGPFAGYTLGGHAGLGGVAGVLGAGVTLVLAGVVFRLLRRRPPSDTA
jgi:cobalt/nickel transport protein